MSTSRVIILLLVVLAVVQYLYYEPLLPERVATHYDGRGIANEWASKDVFLLGNLGAVVGFAVLFLGLTSLTTKIPNYWINMPNKDYWLAPERRAETLGQLQRQMEWLGAATIALILAIGQLSIEANLRNAPMDNRTFWILFGAYMIGFLAWMVGLLRWSFRKPPTKGEGVGIGRR